MNEKRIRRIVEDSIKNVLKRRSSDGTFDLERIPMEVLDRGWKRYHPYLLMMTHGNTLVRGRIAEDTNYRRQLEEIRTSVLNVFPISGEQFLVREGANGLYAAILVALTDDNVDVMEDVMRLKGFFRSKPTDEDLLIDRKNRRWLDMRFEPMHPDDVTEELHEKFRYIQHLAPKAFEDKIEKEGVLASNNNRSYRYSEDRAYFSVGEMEEEKLLNLVDTLYLQAKKKRRDADRDYVLFSFDLTKLDSSFRFFYDINEENGIYATKTIPPEAISGKREIRTRIGGDKLI